MENKDGFEFGKEALENSNNNSANPRNIPETKSNQDIYNLCEDALKEGEEAFKFIYKGKEYSATLEKSFILSEVISNDSDGEPDDFGDVVGKVFKDDYDWSHFNGTHFG